MIHYYIHVKLWDCYELDWGNKEPKNEVLIWSLYDSVDLIALISDLLLP